MALTKEEKDQCLSTAISLAFKMAEGGGAEKGGEIANCIEFTYQTLSRLTEETKN